MIAAPIVATTVSALFAWQLWRRYRGSRRIQLLAWSLSLAMFGVASLTLVLADLYGWGPWLYRVFWLFGALLNVPWLALGSAALAWPRLARPASWVLIIGSLGLIVATMLEDPSASKLALEDGVPLGKEVWPPGSIMLPALRIASIGGWLIVVGLALWTSRTRDGMRPSTERVRGNLLIAAGVTIVAMGGFALSRLGGTAAFSAALGVGVLVMYVGFVSASRAPRFIVTDPGDQPT